MIAEFQLKENFTVQCEITLLGRRQGNKKSMNLKGLIYQLRNTALYRRLLQTQICHFKSLYFMSPICEVYYENKNQCEYALKFVIIIKKYM